MLLKEGGRHAWQLSPALDWVWRVYGWYLPARGSTAWSHTRSGSVQRRKTIQILPKRHSQYWNVPFSAVVFCYNLDENLSHGHNQVIAPVHCWNNKPLLTNSEAPEEGLVYIRIHAPNKPTNVCKLAFVQFWNLAQYVILTGEFYILLDNY